MALTVKKADGGLYEATATPPHLTGRWSTTAPLPLRALINELKVQGCHQRDIGDALYEIEPAWVSKLQE
jgi:hypothetical protein